MGRSVLGILALSIHLRATGKDKDSLHIIVSLVRKQSIRSSNDKLHDTAITTLYMLPGSIAYLFSSPPLFYLLDLIFCRLHCVI